MLEGARGRDLEQCCGPAAVILAQHLDELRRRPGVELALHSLAVGVPGRGESALGGAHVAQQEVGRLAHDALGERITGEPPPVQVDPQEQGVVVEHLLEVRHDPRVVDGVAREAAAELVVDPPAGHGLAGALHHGQRLVPGGAFGARSVAQEELQHHRRGELRRATESPARGVVGLAQGGDRGLEVRGRRRHPLGGHGPLPLGEGLGDPLGGPRDLVASVAPRLGDRGEQLRERRHSVPWLGREVGPRVEGPAVRVGEDAHRPAAVPGERDGRVHVDGVDVGALFAVDLDADEVVVEELRDRLVLEGLVRHDMAPVAGRVADGDEDGHAAAPCLVERLLPPLPPVDRIVGVLLQIGRGGVGEAVGHGKSLLPRARNLQKPPPHGSPAPPCGPSIPASGVGHPGGLAGLITVTCDPRIKR